MKVWRGVAIFSIIACLVIFSASLCSGSVLAYPINPVPPKPNPVVCIHFHSNMKLQLAKKLIDEAQKLGARYIRFDIWWYEIEPKKGVFNYKALRFYQEITNYMESKFIMPIAIVGTGYPNWVLTLILEYIISTYGFLALPHSPPPFHILSQSSFQASKVPNLQNEKLEIIHKAIIDSLQHYNPLLEIKILKYIAEHYPAFFNATKKGYLTPTEIRKLISKYPSLSQILSNNVDIYKCKNKIPFPNLAERYTRAKALATIYKRGGYKALIPDIAYNFLIIQVLEGAYQYAYTVAKYLWSTVEYYQLGNELNWINAMPKDCDIAFIEALARGVHDGFHDGALECGIPCTYGLPYTIVNVFADCFFWSNYLESWLNSAAGSWINIIAIDHYPGTWTMTSYSDWSPLVSLIKIAQQYHKIPAIMETGYPTKGDDHNEKEQVKFINTAFSVIAKIASKHQIAFVSWYTLWDEPHSGILWYSGWGVLTNNFTKKHGWYALKDWFANFTSS